ncbi:MAG TPA: trypsin-like peptidase domain-containing protein [Gaiellaceae bacterium]|nr:trypsin-like peptidase domain-containing protein [Gaiellaceae bacterium]
MTSKRAIALTSAGVLAILAVGAGAGAGLYAAFAPASTTTIVRDVDATGSVQNASSSAGAGSIGAIYQRVHLGVVDITVESTAANTSPLGGSRQTQAEGSGWVYDAKGDIVTNEHVVSGAKSITVTLSNGKSFNAHLVGSDSSTDLAVVRISAPSSLLAPLTVGNSDAVQIGDPVVAIGSPFGLPGTVTSGIVSALHRTIDSPNNFTISNAIQTDAPINHGNSGGPLLNTAGEVIGVNSQIESDSGGSDGVGFAIPSNTVRSVVAQIVAGKTVAHAYFGVEVTDSSSPLGAALTRIFPGTPAAGAGLKAGDVVTKLDGKTVSGESDLSAVIAAKKPGDKMTVTYLRDGKTATVTITLATRPS